MKNIISIVTAALLSGAAMAQSTSSNMPQYGSGYLVLPGSISEFALAGGATRLGLNTKVFSLNTSDETGQASVFTIPKMTGDHGPESSYTRANLSYRINETTRLTGNLGYYSAGNVELRDEDGNELGVFTPYETDVRIGVAKTLSEGFNLGVRLGYLSTNLGSSFSTAQIKESTLLVDFSLDYIIKSSDKSEVVAFWSLNNVGKKDNFTADNLNYVPAQMSLGILIDYELNEDMRLIPQVSFQKMLVPTPPVYNSDGSIFSGQPQNTNILGSLFTSFNDAPNGMNEEIKEWCPILASEVVFKEAFRLSLGASLESTDKGNRQFVSAGLGYQSNKISMMVAYLIPVSVEAGFYKNRYGIGLSYNI